MAACPKDNYDCKEVRRQATSKSSSHNPRDPTFCLRNNTFTEISNRLVKKFLEMPCEKACSLKLVCGPKKTFQATITPLEEEEVEQKYGPNVYQQLFAAENAKLQRLTEIYKKLQLEQKSIKESIPQPVTIRSSSTSNRTSKTGSIKSKKNNESKSYHRLRKSKKPLKNSDKLKMKTSFWMFGSSNSI